ncbi:hypothetical protein BDF19DRAFT_429068 [Syncephalis fuscata]|nr:hypothetical protein BDF19DRAFT_429068 [Syncephalis fuscata]
MLCKDAIKVIAIATIVQMHWIDNTKSRPVNGISPSSNSQKPTTATTNTVVTTKSVTDPKKGIRQTLNETGRCIKEGVINNASEFAAGAAGITTIMATTAALAGTMGPNAQVVGAGFGAVVAQKTGEYVGQKVKNYKAKNPTLPAITPRTLKTTSSAYKSK